MIKVRKYAQISQDRQYRYRLSRKWGNGPLLLFIMLNPSTADSERDDPTVRRCIGFAKQWGFDGIQVVNLFAYRSPDRTLLYKVKNPVGPLNDAYLDYAAEHHWPRVAAWGAHAPVERVKEVLTLPHMHTLMCLGVTKSGSPRHPLYVRADAELIPWPVNPTIPKELP